MTWLVDLRRFARPCPDRIGPGRLILVVGPSGAGKDTLIAGAKLACADDPSVVFPRRVITRRPSSAEENEAVSEQAFNRLVDDGAFALWWDAHSHRYGILSSMDEDIRIGRTVVCNTSRTIIGVARRKYATVTVVLVTAPTHVLAQRLKGRNRTSDGPVNDRLARAAALGKATDADIVINNVGRPVTAVRRLLNAIHGCRYFIIS